MQKTRAELSTEYRVLSLDYWIYCEALDATCFAAIFTPRELMA